MNITIPKELVAGVAAVFGEPGRAWLLGLPRLMTEVKRQWQLAEIGPPFSGARSSFVAPVVSAADQELVLKISPSPESVRHEALVLQYWNGQAAVKVRAVDVAKGALLMERAIPGTSVAAMASLDDRAATQIIADVIVHLQAKRAASPIEFPSIESWLDALRGPVGCFAERLGRIPSEARSVAQELLRNRNEWVVLHGDLHHHNVLNAGGKWLAIDPKGIVGPREIEAAAMLRNPRRYLLENSNRAEVIRSRISAVASHLDFDPMRVAQWSFVLAVLAAVWAAEDGEGEVEMDRWLAIAVTIREAGQG